MTATDVHVGQRLSERRRELALSQAELAMLIGVTASELDRFESGAVRVGPRILCLLGQALGVTVAWFFDRSTSHQELGATQQGKTDAPQSPRSACNNNQAADEPPAVESDNVVQFKSHDGKPRN